MLIAQRTLLWKSAGADQVTIAVRLFSPTQTDGAWTCRYEIDWPDKRRSKFAGGADSMQALILALRMIGSDIVASAYYSAGEITFNGSYLGCGFPVPNSIRDTLRGDDAAFS